MMETLEQLWRDALVLLTQFFTVAYAAALEFARGLDPRAWWIGGGAALLLLLWALLRRRKGSAKGRPEVLLSLGTISMSGGPSESIDARSDRLLPEQFLLRLTVSNLNAYAVQVLEVALKTPEMEVPVTAEVAAVVPPEGSVTLEEPLAELTGDEGRLNLYFYTAGSKRLFRVATSFALEPWNSRYKISPLNQTIAPAKQLASAGVSRLQERVWRQERTDPTLPRDPERAASQRRTPDVAQHSAARRTAQEHTPTKVVSYPEPTETPRHGGSGFPDEF